jgi:uncharacterized protein YdbL (DUF1318 family)
MRLDIYQHIEKDIDAIESIVLGSQEKANSQDKQSLLDYFAVSAYAQEGLDPQTEQAALRRRDRRSELVSREEKSVIGENKSGLVELRNPGASDSSLEQLIKLENEDRMIIYQAVARKNNASIDEIQKIYAKRLQKDASSGTPIEALNETSGACEWKVKQ